MTKAADTSDHLIAFVYVSLCGQRGSRDVERTSALGHGDVTTLGGTVPSIIAVSKQQQTYWWENCM